MSRRLKTIAKEINEEIEGLSAEVVPSHSSTDRKLGGGSRLIHRGKGRRGNKLTVWVTALGKAHKVYSHDASETYRSNDEVEYWLAQWKTGKYWEGSRRWKTKDVLKGKPWREG